MRSRFLLTPILVTFVSAVAVSTAFAHHLPPGMEEVDEFSDNASFLLGMNHPLSGLDHIAVALLTGWLAARLMGWFRGGLIPGAVLALLFGALMVPAGLGLPFLEPVLAASAVFAAVAASLQSSGARRAGAVLLLVLQVWQGNAHALAAPVKSSALYLTGMCAATTLVMVLGWSLSLLAKRHLPGVLAGAQPA